MYAWSFGSNIYLYTRKRYDETIDMKITIEQVENGYILFFHDEEQTKKVVCADGVWKIGS